MFCVLRHCRSETLQQISGPCCETSLKKWKDREKPREASGARKRVNPSCKTQTGLIPRVPPLFFSVVNCLGGPTLSQKRVFRLKDSFKKAKRGTALSRPIGPPKSLRLRIIWAHAAIERPPLHCPIQTSVDAHCIAPFKLLFAPFTLPLTPIALPHSNFCLPHSNFHWRPLHCLTQTSVDADQPFPLQHKLDTMNNCSDRRWCPDLLHREMNRLRVKSGMSTSELNELNRQVCLNLHSNNSFVLNLQPPRKPMSISQIIDLHFGRIRTWRQVN